MRHSSFNQNIWITGASDGIGKALAMLLAAQGNNLFLSARNTEALDRVKAECLAISKNNSAHTNIELHPFDCRDIGESINISEVLAPKVDLVILCAGVSQRAFAFDMDTTTDKSIYKVNFVSPMESVKTMINIWRQQAAPKQIVYISSVAAHIATPLRAMYASSKLAFEHYSQILINELRKNELSHIGVSIIIPGFVNTNISQKALQKNAEVWNKQDKNQARGISAMSAAKKIVKAIEGHKTRTYIGMNFSLYMIVFLSKHVPWLASRILVKVSTTG